MAWNKDAPEVKVSQDTIDSLNQKIIELEAKHNNLSNLIDGALKDAQSQADKILQDANDKATKILIDASQVRKEADDYLQGKRVESDGVISDAHTLLHRGSQEKAKFESDKLAFEDYKAKAQAEIDANNAILELNLKNFTQSKAELNDLSVKLVQLQKDLQDKKTDLDSANAFLAQNQADLQAKQDAFTAQVTQLQKDQDTLAQQVQNTYVTQKYLEDARAKLDALVKSNTDLQDTLNQRKATLDTQQATIASDMSALSLQKQAQDETERTQSDKQRDINLQVQALNQKIQVLNDLRAANQKVS